MAGGNVAQAALQDSFAANGGLRTGMKNCCAGCGCANCRCCGTGGNQPPFGQQPGFPGNQPPFGQQPGFPGLQPPGQQPGFPGNQPPIGNQPGAPGWDPGVLGPQKPFGAQGVQAGGPDTLEGQIRTLIDMVRNILAQLGVNVGGGLQLDTRAGNAPGGVPANAPGADFGGAPVAAPGGAAPAAAAAPAAGAAGPTDQQAGAFEKRLFELTNQVRRGMGLRELTWNDNMATLARRSAQAKTHTAAPEVLAPWGYSSPEEAMDAWRQSPGHWGIITDPNLTEMGAGWVGDGAAMTFGTVEF